MFIVYRLLLDWLRGGVETVVSSHHVPSIPLATMPRWIFVIDGDTVDVVAGRRKRISVRYIGVDTPGAR
ncbi:MAG: hypothetical protein H6668_06115 [Ardenticatenaceae bacterium]|nr:hypothetical protein [Ardenticatenaceae bacterium]